MFKRATRVPVLTGLILVALLFLPVLFPESVQAAEKIKLGQNFPSIEDSKAYQQFKTRPVSELSKLIFLIDRFGSSPIEVVFNGHYYKAMFGAQVAKFFLAQNYRKETVKEWIMKWCNVSPEGNLIWVKFPDNRFKLARDVLQQEVVGLEAVIKAEEARKFAAPDLSSEEASMANATATVLEKTANAAPSLESSPDALRKTKTKPVALAS